MVDWFIIYDVNNNGVISHIFTPFHGMHQNEADVPAPDWHRLFCDDHGNLLAIIYSSGTN